MPEVDNILARSHPLRSGISSRWSLENRSMSIHLRIAILSLVSMLVLGCADPGTRVDPALVEHHRSRLLLADEPTGAQAVLDVRAIFTGQSEEDILHHLSTDPPEGGPADGELEFTEADVTVPTTTEPVGPQEVVVVGKIGGMPNPWPEKEPDFPWKKQVATVFLVDPATAEEFGHSEHDKACDCPFCARKVKDNIDSLAVVNFVDPSGEVLHIGAQPLLDLEEQATIVVRGQARLVGGKMLVIDADAMYVRR
jgi:hypothetical protein